MQIIFWKHW